MIHIFNIKSIIRLNVGIGQAEAALLKELEELSPVDLERIEITGIEVTGIYSQPVVKDGGVSSRLIELIFQWAKAKGIPLNIKWDVEEYNYYREEMSRLLPVDQYGFSFQIRTTRGTTKWLALNPDSLRIFNELIVPAMPVPLPVGHNPSLAVHDHPRRSH